MEFLFLTVIHRKTRKSRVRYDRHEALADPGRALRRAATDAAVKGLTALGKGLFDVSSQAVHMAWKMAMEEYNNHQQQEKQQSPKWAL